MSERWRTSSNSGTYPNTVVYQHKKVASVWKATLVSLDRDQLTYDLYRQSSISAEGIPRSNEAWYEIQSACWSSDHARM